MFRRLQLVRRSERYAVTDTTKPVTPLAKVLSAAQPHALERLRVLEARVGGTQQPVRRVRRGDPPEPGSCTYRDCDRPATLTLQFGVFRGEGLACVYCQTHARFVEAIGGDGVARVKSHTHANLGSDRVQTDSGVADARARAHTRGRDLRRRQENIQNAPGTHLWETKSDRQRKGWS
jgi:hypothetical protein